MAPNQDLPRRVSRKLTKKRKPIRTSSVQFPERLREGEDAQEDVTATNGKPAQYMNQSVFSMIAAAGSKVDFNARFDEESSESEEDQIVSKPGRRTDSSGHNIDAMRKDEFHEESLAGTYMGEERDASSERKSFHALPKLRLNSIREKNYMSQSTILPSPQDSPTSRSSPNGITPRDAPVMSKMLEAQAELSPSTLLSETQKEELVKLEPSGQEKSPTKLVLRLKEIFEFEGTEDVISGALMLTLCSCIGPLIRRQSIHAGFCKVFFFKDICMLHKNISAFMHICLKDL